MHCWCFHQQLPSETAYFVGDNSNKSGTVKEEGSPFLAFSPTVHVLKKFSFLEKTPTMDEQRRKE